MKPLFFYYGLEAPAISELKKIEESTFIVQPYHPWSFENKWKQEMPINQKIFLYFNCYKIPQADYDKFNDKTAITNREETWKTVTLDLNCEKNFKLKLQEALSILETIDCDGLFLDDLDCAFEAPNTPERLTELVSAIKKQKDIKFILNRGFFHWDKIPSIEAIVLESLIPEIPLEKSDLEWIESIISHNITGQRANKPEIPLYLLSYGHSKNKVQKNYVKQKLDQFYQKIIDLNITILTAQQGLNQWPKYLS